MAKDPNWVNADDVTLDKVVFKMVSKPETAVTQFENGELDTGIMNSMIPDAETEKYAADDRYVNVPVLASQLIWANTKNPLLKDVRVRKALALALDRESIIKNVVRNGSDPLTTVIPQKMPGHDQVDTGFLQGAAQVEAAKDLLKEAGWKDGTEIRFYYTADGSAIAARFATAVQSQLDDVGVKVKLVQLPDFDALIAAGTPPLSADVGLLLLSWIADFNDPYNFYNLFRCGSDLQSAQFCSKEYDALLDSMPGTPSFDDRVKLYGQAEELLLGPDGEFPVLPVYTDTERTLVQPWVEGYELNPQLLVDMSTVKILEH